MENTCFEKCWDCPFVIEDEDTGNRICGLGGTYDNSLEEIMEDKHGDQE